MINNRQNGRRRGRGGTRPPNGTNNGPERGSRIDNRARGNANQLHEKYKTLARDAQMQGDRVMTEYYLQFADHYFRVLNESRARFEEQRRFRDDTPDFDDEDGDGEMNAGFDDRGDDGGQDYREQAPRAADGNRQDRDGNRQDRDGNRQDRYEGRQRDRQQERGDRNGEPRRREGRPDRQAERSERSEQPRQAEQRAPQEPVEHERQSDVRPNDLPAQSEAPVVAQESSEVMTPAAAAERPRRGRPRRDRSESAPVEANEGDGAPERIEIDRLPPAFSAPEPASQAASDAAPASAEEGEEAPRRRRTRRPRAEAASPELL